MTDVATSHKRIDHYFIHVVELAFALVNILTL